MGLDWLRCNYKHNPLTGQFKGRLFVVASGRCVWEDVEKCMGHDGDAMCVNDMIMHYPFHVKHAYSNDKHWLPKWIDARRPRYIKDLGAVEFSHTCATGATKASFWPWPGHGSSTFNAVLTGLALGYDEIVVCGAPLDESGHYFDPPWVHTKFNKEVPDRDGVPMHWKTARDNVFSGKVKALSGRTRQCLGAPGWLSE